MEAAPGPQWLQYNSMTSMNSQLRNEGMWYMLLTNFKKLVADDKILIA